MADNNIQIKLSLVEDVNKGLADAQKGIEKFASSAVASHRKISDGVDSISTQMERYKNLYLGLFQALPRAAAGIQSLGQMAESWKMVNARLTNATQGQVDFANAQARVIAIANQTGQSLDAVAGLYGKLRTNAGMAAEDADRLTAILAKATQLDGGGQGAAAALTQLQQGLASGALRGEELNSVLEQTPTLALSIARGLGMTTGQLREYAQAGKLTAETVKQALFDQEAAISRQFANLPVTVGRAMENVRTAAIQELGKLDAAGGFTESIAAGLQSVSENLRTVVGVSAAATAAITGAWLQSIATRAAAEQAAHINSLRLIAERKAAELASAKASLAASSISLTGPALIAARQNIAALAAQSVAAGSALQAAGRQASVFSAAFAGIGRAATLVTGPVGLTVTAIGTIAGAIYAARDSVIDLETTQATVWETLRAGWQLLADGVVGALATVADAVGLSGIEWQSIFSSAFDGILSFARNFVNGIVGSFVGIGDAIGKTGGFIYESFRIAFDAIGDLVVALGRDVQAAMSGNFDMSNMQAALSRGLEGAKANWQNYADSIGESMQKALGTDYVGAALSKVKRTLAEQVRETRNALADADAEKWLNGIADSAANAGKASVASGAAAKKAASDYDRLISSIRDKIAVEQAASQSQEKLTEGQKLAAKFVADIAAGQIKLTDAKKQAATAALNELILLEKSNDARERAAKAEADRLNAGKKALETIDEQIKRQREENEQIGLTVDQLDALKLSRLDATIAAKEQALATLEAGSASAAEVQVILRQIDALRELRGITASSQIKTANAKAIDDQTKAWENFSRDIEQSLTDALMRSFEAGDDFGEAFVKSLQNTIKAAVLKLAVQVVLDPITGHGGMLQQASGALGLGGQGGIGAAVNTASNAYSLYGNLTGAPGSLYNNFATSSIGQMLGLGTSTMAASWAAAAPAAATAYLGTGTAVAGLGTGTAAAGLSATAGTAGATTAGLTGLGAALPWVGGALAVASILGGLFGGSGERFKTTYGSASGDFDDGRYTSQGAYLDGRQFGSDVDKALDRATQAFSARIGGLFDAFGLEDDLMARAGVRLRRASGRLASGFEADLDGADGPRGFESLLNKQYGGDGEIEKALTEFITDIMTVGIKGAVASSDLPNIVKELFAPLSDAQEIENALATVINAQQMLAEKGSTLADFLGDSAESFMRGEENLVGMLNRVVGSLALLNPVLEDINQSAFAVTLAGGDAASQLAAMAGGVEAFVGKVDAYYQGYFSEAERVEKLTTKVGEAFAGLDIEVPDTRAEFRAIVEGLDITTEAGRETFAAMIDLAPAFGAVADAAEKISAGRQSWQDRLDVLTGSTTQRDLDLQRALASTTDDATKAIIRQIYAQEDLISAQEDLISAQEKSAAATQTFVDRITEMFAQGAAEAAAQRDNRNRLTIDLYKAQGNTAAATALSRQLELASEADPVARGIMQAIWDALDKAVVDQKESEIIRIAQSWQNRLDVLTGATTQRELDLQRDLASTTDIATQALIRQVYAQEDFANATKLAADREKEAASLLRARQGLDIEIMRLTGDAVGALTLQRQLELDALDESLRPMQERIYALQDARGLTDGALDGLAKSIAAQKEAIGKSYDQQVAALQRKKEADASAYTAQIEAAREAQRRIVAVAGDIKSALATTTIESESLSQARRQAALALLGQAASSGQSLASYPGLDAALAAIQQPSQELYASFEDYARDQARAASVLGALEQQAAAQSSVADMTLSAVENVAAGVRSSAQAQIDALQGVRDASLEALDDQLQQAQTQVDALRGIDTSVLSVRDAIDRLASAMGAESALTGGSSNAVSSVAALTTAVVSAAETAASLYGNYDELLGSAANPDNLGSGWMPYVPGTSQRWAKVGSYDVQEYYDLANGESIDSIAAWARKHGIPGFAVGTNYVPRDMLAMVHEGEAIVPRPYNPAAGGGADLSGELRALRTENAELRRDMNRLLALIAENTHATASAVHGNQSAPLLVEIA